MKAHIKENRSKLIKTLTLVRKQNILARSNFWCCQSCGCADLQDRFEKAPEDKKPAGYMFWHDQDDQRIESNESVMLCYGGFGPFESRTIGRKVVSILEENGFTCNWDGNDNTRIEVDLSSVRSL